MATIMPNQADKTTGNNFLTYHPNTGITQAVRALRCINCSIQAVITTTNSALFKWELRDVLNAVT